MRQTITLTLLILALGLMACPSSSPENSQTQEETPVANELDTPSEAASSTAEEKELIHKMDFESGTLEEADAVQGAVEETEVNKPQDD